MADLAAEEAAAGRGPIDRLHDLWDEVGLWVSTQQSIVRTGSEGQEALLAAVDRLGACPPSELSGTEITGVTDYRIGDEDRPPWLGAQDLIELELGEEGRILVRPSGTEPKLKIYVDLSGSTGPDHATAHGRLLARAQVLAAAMEEWLEV
jgi:phosphomannomutase